MNKFINKATLITYSAFLLLYLLDQLSKQMIINNFPITIDIVKQAYSDSPPYYVFPYFYLKHVVNFGAAFSIFYGKVLPLILIVSTIVTALIVYERKTSGNRPALLSVSFGMIIAGALGNLTDRIRLGYVTDFFAIMKDNKILWPVFNVADMSVNIGVGLFILYIFLYESKEKKTELPPEEKGNNPAEESNIHPAE